MPSVTYLSPEQVRRYSSVPDDKECDELLQEMRHTTNEEWLIEVRTVSQRPSPMDRFLRRVRPSIRVYTLYVDCHGEWQIINCVMPGGRGSVFTGGPATREAVMNYMLGHIAGVFAERRWRG